ncbi:NAD(P)/FAD-dependent oxidoreductase [Desertibaculum subflavum]|uniref:FAD/NAD(P)-dependent oxidoreductase n=1 Tax=Desertibaculum subflavum TaxID=2268458 RepID=UPI0013C538B6
MADAARIAIIGAGPAGLAAAIALAEAGIACTLIDDNREAGGQIFRAGAALPPDIPGIDRRGRELRRRLAALASRIDHRRGTEVVAIDAERKLWLAGEDGRRGELPPDVVILCPGAVELFAPVPGWTLPGVFGLGGLQVLLKAGAVPEGPVVLAGAGPLLRLLAAQLIACGVELAAVVDASPLPGPGAVADMTREPALLARGLALEAAIVRARVPLLRRHAVVAIEGAGAVECVEVAPVDSEWRLTGRSRRQFRCTALGLGYGLRPNVELTLLAGAEHAFDPALGGWHVRRSPDLESSVRNIFVAGDGAGVQGVEAALAEGAIVAYAAAVRTAHPNAASLYPAAARARERLARLARFRRGLAAWSAPRAGIFDAARPDTFVCRCEDVTRREIDAALAAGFGDMRALKLRTRAGMGLCQGRVCAPIIQHLAAAATGRAPAEVPLPTARPPLRPVPATALADLPMEAAP